MARTWIANPTNPLEAPASIRGLCTCVFTGFVYLGIVLAYFTNYGCQVNLGDNTHKRWVCHHCTHFL